MELIVKELYNKVSIYCIVYTPSKNESGKSPSLFLLFLRNFQTFTSLLIGYPNLLSCLYLVPAGLTSNGLGWPSIDLTVRLGGYACESVYYCPLL